MFLPQIVLVLIPIHVGNIDPVGPGITAIVGATVLDLALVLAVILGIVAVPDHVQGVVTVNSNRGDALVIVAHPLDRGLMVGDLPVLSLVNGFSNKDVMQFLTVHVVFLAIGNIKIVFG